MYSQWLSSELYWFALCNTVANVWNWALTPFLARLFLCNKSALFLFRGLKILMCRRSSCLDVRGKYTWSVLHLLYGHTDILWSLEYQVCSFFVFLLLPPYILHFLIGTGLLAIYSSVLSLLLYRNNFSFLPVRSTQYIGSAECNNVFEIDIEPFLLHWSSTFCKVR